MKNYTKKLADLSEIEGMSEEEMFRQGTFDSVAYGICVNEECDYTIQIEPDATDGWCPECETNTVKSCLVLAGIM